MLKSAEMIRTALNEVGCEELPSGCDDLSVEQNFIENNGSPVDQPVSVVCSIIDTFFFYFYLCQMGGFFKRVALYIIMLVLVI